MILYIFYSRLNPVFTPRYQNSIVAFYSFAETKDTVIELQPKQYDLKEPSPPPSYNDSLPPSYSSVVKHNTVARSAEEGGAAVTTLASPTIIDLPSTEGIFSCRPRSLSAGKMLAISQYRLNHTGQYLVNVFHMASFSLFQCVLPQLPHDSAWRHRKTFRVLSDLRASKDI